MRVPKLIHIRIGDVVRIAPSELSFGTSSSLKDIYARDPNRKVFPKANLYDSMAFGFKEPGIATELNVQIHKRKRNLIRPVFMSSSLKDFIPIMDIHLEKLCTQLKIRTQVAEGVNMVDWFHYITVRSIIANTLIHSCLYYVTV